MEKSLADDLQLYFTSSIQRRQLLRPANFFETQRSKTWSMRGFSTLHMTKGESWRLGHIYRIIISA